MNNKINIAIVGLGQVGIYLLNELNIKKKDIELKTGKKINLVAVSAKNINKKRKFKFDERIFYKNPLEIFRKVKVDILFEAIGSSDGISKKVVETALRNKKRDAIVIRTLPNLEEKKSMQYSNTNPTYLSEKAAIYLREKGIKHLLIDLPSVDKEKDDGNLLSHNAFWNTAGEIRMDATITEFIFVPNSVEDGEYLLNLMIAPFENDATPSKPILYEIIK